MSLLRDTKFRGKVNLHTTPMNGNLDTSKMLLKIASTVSFYKD